MIIITKIRVQLLNGNNIIKQIPLELTKELKGSKDLEDYRRELKKKYRDEILPAYRLEHPENELPKIDVLFTLKYT